MSTTTRTAKVSPDIEVRYEWTSFGSWGEWCPRAWRLLGGQWRSCRSPRTAARLGFQARKCLPEVK